MRSAHLLTILVCVLVVPLMLGQVSGDKNAGPAQEAGDKAVEPAKAAEPDASGKLYTSYNLWYENPEKMSCINYHRGAMIPAGTEVSSVTIGKRVFKQAITFTTAKDKVTYWIYFGKKFHPGVTIGTFKDRLFTEKSFDKLTEGLTEEEIAYVKRGELSTGMGKQAVLIARGYPPEHKTASIESNRWLYWESRFSKVAVQFDENGRVSYILD